MRWHNCSTVILYRVKIEKFVSNNCDVVATELSIWYIVYGIGYGIFAISAFRNTKSFCKFYNTVKMIETGCIRGLYNVLKRFLIRFLKNPENCCNSIFSVGILYRYRKKYRIPSSAH